MPTNHFETATPHEAHVCPPNPPVCKCRPIWLVYGAAALATLVIFCSRPSGPQSKENPQAVTPGGSERSTVEWRRQSPRSTLPHRQNGGN